ncbi:hypothetical protein [Roseicitreum antarcticum]|uniref:hypothetical protein n=1 Tax=Roseicitreum antarcticum TaxID=564137 RepID=UPI00115FBBC8|nr:hypothetical protein [Roseicitreum antarcticum]
MTHYRTGCNLLSLQGHKRRFVDVGGLVYRTISHAHIKLTSHSGTARHGNIHSADGWDILDPFK